ncbi:hypothetical protein ACFL5Z_11525 [Planctomycetota bacterium]
MKPNNEKNFGLGVSNVVDLFAGSSVRLRAAGTRLLLQKNTKDTELYVQCILFDWKTGHGSDEVIRMSADEIGDLFAPGEYVAAVLGNDPEFLAKAEHEGLFRYLPENWSLSPGASLDNTGGCGDTRVGITLAMNNAPFLIKKQACAIQNVMAHERQARLVLRGQGLESRATRVALRYLFSTTGATGNGTTYWFLMEGAPIASDNSGVRTKVVLNGIIRANLAIADTEKADLNELMLLKYLRARSSGYYVNPETGQVTPCPFDLLFLSSSQNRNGTMRTLDELLSHEAWSDFIFWYTSAGAKSRERLSDIESWEFDSYGDPHPVFTRSGAFISCSQQRVQDYSRNQGAALFATRLLAEGDMADTRKQAAGFARLCGIIESDQDNQITADMLKFDDFDGENLLDRAKAIFAGPLESTRGLQRAAIAADAVNNIRSSDIPETFEPLMKKQAGIKLHTVIKKLDTLSSQLMRRPPGLWELRQIFDILKRVSESSQRAVMDNINSLQELIKPHEEILTEASEQLQVLEESSRLNQVYNRLLISRVTASLEESGQAAIYVDLQIAACTTAVEDFLTPLVEYLDQKLAWLSAWGQKLQQLSHSFKQKADNIVQESTSLSSPPGFELTTAEYLHNKFSQYLKQLGDKEGLALNLLNRLLTKYDSLAGLPEASIQECEEVFKSVCNDVFAPMVQIMDVVSEFKKLFPDPHTQEKIFEQVILRSEGRLSTTSEVNHQTSWLKIVSVPKSEYTGWACQCCEKVDKKAGKWEVAIHSDPDTITVMQVRGDISLTPFIKRLEPPDDSEHWAKIVSRAPDPPSALMVGPNPTPRQFRRVLAKAIAADLLTINGNGEFVLKGPRGNTLALGKDYASAEQNLHPQWRLLAFVESTFGHCIVIAEEEIRSRLEDLQKKLGSVESSSDKRLCLVDQTAVQEASIHLDLIAPWARRLRQANHKKLVQNVVDFNKDERKQTERGRIIYE